MKWGYPSLAEIQDCTFEMICQCSAAELVCSIAFPVACDRTSCGNAESTCRHGRRLPVYLSLLCGCIVCTLLCVLSKQDWCVHIGSRQTVFVLFYTHRRTDRWTLQISRITLQCNYQVTFSWYRVISPGVKPPFNADAKYEPLLSLRFYGADGVYFHFVYTV